MRISTCKYSRFKMKIAQDSKCSFCDCEEESLEHIFIDCPAGTDFIAKLNTHITTKFDAAYSDENRLYLITSNHDNIIINYVNLAAKWYLSRSYQHETKPSWLGFIRAIKKYLIGEKSKIKDPVLDSFT